MNAKTLCIALLFGVTVDAQTKDAETSNAQNRRMESPAAYTYSYGVSDPRTGDHKSHSETRNSGMVKGHYSLLESDGTIRTVHYIADPIFGFRAFVSKSGPSLHPSSETSMRYLEKPIVVANLKPTPHIMEDQHILPKPPSPYNFLARPILEHVEHLFAPVKQQVPPVPGPFLEAPAFDAPYYPYSHTMMDGIKEWDDHFINTLPKLNHAKAPVIRMTYDNTAAPVPIYLGHAHDLGEYFKHPDMGYAGYKLIYDNKFD